jgi:hypothetical protein
MMMLNFVIGHEGQQVMLPSSSNDQQVIKSRLDSFVVKKDLGVGFLLSLFFSQPAIVIKFGSRSSPSSKSNKFTGFAGQI